MRYVSHFPPFAQMAALRSNSSGLIHLKLEEVLKDSALKTDPRRSGLQRTFPDKTLTGVYTGGGGRGLFG